MSSRAFSLICMFEGAVGFIITISFSPKTLVFSKVEKVVEKYGVEIVEAPVSSAKKEVKIKFKYSGKDTEKIKKALIGDLKSLGGNHPVGD